MITRCLSCGEDHWSYTGAPFRPWCSFVCWRDRGKRQHDRGEAERSLLFEIGEHNSQVHGTADVTRLFAFCDTCEYLHEALEDFRRQAARKVRKRPQPNVATAESMGSLT